MWFGAIAMSLALVCGLPAPSAAAPAGHLILNPGKGGANTVWISGNDAGQAVGQKVTGAVSDFVYFDGKHPHDLTPRLGHGAFSSIDALGDAVGTTSQGLPLYYNTRTGKKVVLQMPGRATGVAIGPLVAVSLANGTAELWNPLSSGTLSLGQASTTGVNAGGIVVGHAADGNLWYSVPNGSGGATQHELTIAGNFDHVSNRSVATGYERVGNRILPVRFTIATGTAASAHVATSGLQRYRLPRGAMDGVLIGENDIGTIAFGNVGRSDMLLPSTAVRWAVPSNPIKVPIKGLVRGVYDHFRGASNISFNSDTGWFGGALTVRKVDVAYLFEPRPILKLLGLEKAVLEAKWVSAATETAVRKRLSDIHNLIAKGDRSAACRKMSLSPLFVDEKAYLAVFDGADAPVMIDFYDDLADGLWDLARELGCLPELKTAILGNLLSPTDSQSPYAGTPLAWNSQLY